MNQFVKGLFLSLALLLVSCFFLSSVHAANQPVPDTSAGQGLVDFIQMFFPSGNGSSSSSSSSSDAISPTPVVGQNTKATKATSVTSMRGLFGEISQKVQIPSSILEAVMIVEHGDMFDGLSQAQIDAYSQPGGIVPGCKVNECSAAGPMQFSTGVDDRGSRLCPRCCEGSVCSLPTHGGCPNAWSGYRDSVNAYGGYSHQSNVCNLRDNLYAAAAKLKKDGGGGATGWTQQQVTRAISAYYGSCASPMSRFSGRNYCEQVYYYYTTHQ